MVSRCYEQSPPNEGAKNEKERKKRHLCVLQHCHEAAMLFSHLTKQQGSKEKMALGREQTARAKHY
jgi:hypothetical protein